MTQQLERSQVAAGDLEDLAARLDAALARTGDLDPAARAVLDEVLLCLNGLHKQGLTTIVRDLREDERGKELLFALVDDPTVRMLLAMHGLIRPDPTALARQVLERVRPGLQSHGGDVELSHLDGPVAHVRLTGACNGCSMAAVTMRGTVEEALTGGVPGITSVEVVPNDPAPTLVPLAEIGLRPGAAPVGGGAEETGESGEVAELLASGWSRTLPARDVPEGELRTATVDGPAGATDLVLVNAAGRLAAYVNACAHQGLPLDEAEVDAEAGTLTCPWHGFCYDTASGECLTMPGAQLQPLPLRLVAGDAWVRTGG